MKKFFLVVLCSVCQSGFSAGLPGTGIEEILVSGRDEGLVGQADSASVGTVISEQLEHRPLLRPAELLETVPGLIVTQHSGDGKANQYFLRGFNLDHGTDFSTHVDGMPVNMVSHGHGQGYSDLNFLIPEIVDNIVYKKGPYYAEQGDFSSAGGARIQLKNQLEQQQLRVTVGEDDYLRSLYAGEVDVEAGRLLVAAEYQQTDGPWQLPEDLTRKNAVLRYHKGDEQSAYAVTVMAYQAEWLATDQIPQRLVDSGQLDRFGYVTNSSGGETHRYSLSAHWHKNTSRWRWANHAYAIDYQLRLTSNPSYFVNDPIAGDEFTQFDDRLIWGGGSRVTAVLNDHHSLQAGITLRHDGIRDVGVGPSLQGRNTDYIKRDKIQERAIGSYASLVSEWTPWFASTLGLRFDEMTVDVSQVGDDSDQLLSPKLSLRFGPWQDTEYFVNYGKGFHSNDARGVVADSEAVPLLAESEGAEVGLRTAIIPEVQLSFALFALDLESELVFVGDDGTTEPRGATRRSGWELGAFYQPVDWLIIDADVTESRSRFKDESLGADKYVPDAVERVMSLGVSMDFPDGWYAGVRWRYLGARPLLEDNSVRTDATSIVNMNGGYHFTNGLSLGWALINVFDSEDDDIRYLYESLTAAERDAASAPVLDTHFHPVEPRTLRLTAAYQF